MTDEQELHALRARVAQLEGLVAQRATMRVNELVDGLFYLNRAAAAGDPGARQVLGQLAEQLRTIGPGSNGLVIARGPVN